MYFVKAVFSKLPALLCLFAFLGGCIEQYESPEHPRDKVHFPTDLSLSPSGQETVVLSSNADLKYASGAIFLLNNAKLFQALQNSDGTTQLSPKDIVLDRKAMPSFLEKSISNDPLNRVHIIEKRNNALRTLDIANGNFVPKSEQVLFFNERDPVALTFGYFSNPYLLVGFLGASDLLVVDPKNPKNIIQSHSMADWLGINEAHRDDKLTEKIRIRSISHLAKGTPNYQGNSTTFVGVEIRKGFSRNFTSASHVKLLWTEQDLSQDLSNLKLDKANIFDLSVALGVRSLFDLKVVPKDGEAFLWALSHEPSLVASVSILNPARTVKYSPVCQYPTSLLISKDKKFAFVACFKDDMIEQINLETGTTLALYAGDMKHRGPYKLLEIRQSGKSILAVSFNQSHSLGFFDLETLKPLGFLF